MVLEYWLVIRVTEVILLHSLLSNSLFALHVDKIQFHSVILKFLFIQRNHLKNF